MSIINSVNYDKTHTHTERERERAKIATCHTCHWPIYRGDLVHYSSTGSRSGTGVSQRVRGGTTFHSSSGTSHYERWVQCDWCLNESLKELAILRAWEKKWGLCFWWGPFIITFLAFFIFCWLRGGFEEEGFLLITVLVSLILSYVIASIVWWIARFFAPGVNRYQFRNYRPYFIAENCYYCDKFCKKTKSKFGIWENDEEMGKITNNEFKTIRPVCQPCWKEHRKDWVK